MLSRRFAAFPSSLPLARAATMAARSAPVFFAATTATATAAVAVAPGVVSALRSCASTKAGDAAGVQRPATTTTLESERAELEPKRAELGTKRDALEAALDKPERYKGEWQGINGRLAGIDNMIAGIDNMIASIDNMIASIGGRLAALATLRHQVGLLEWRTDLYENVAGAQALSIDGNTKDPATGIELIKMKKSSWFGLRCGDADSNLLIVREWHRVFWERYKEHLHEDYHTCAILGVPDVGKTIALNYVLWKLLTSPSAMGDRRYVVLVLPSSHLVVVFDTKKKTAATQKAVDVAGLMAFIDTFDRDRTQSMYLQDVCWTCGRETRVPWVGIDLPVTLAAAAPAGSALDDFLEASSTSNSEFYIPLFSDAEMDFVARRVWPNHKNWQDRAKKVGNVPRLVFTYNDSFFDQWIWNAEREALRLSDDVFSRYCDRQCGSDLSDRLVAYVPSADFTSFTIVPRTDFILQMARAWRERRFPGGVRNR